MTKRYVAHIVIEAETPLKVGSSSMDFLQDAPVQKDWNGLPMILGTSIAGVLRKSFNGNKADIFGETTGSRVIISNALLVDEKGSVCEEFLTQKTDFLKIFDNLPIREHTAITSKGVAKDKSKFDEEVAYKGTRFKFSIEFIEDDRDTFESILNLLSSPAFRLGGGSTKGFGKFKVLDIKTALVDMASYTSSLNGSEVLTSQNSEAKAQLSKTHTTYILKIKPDDFFMFGSGFGDSDADITPVFEKVVDYSIGDLAKKRILIPASSIKGALAHKTAFYYNKSQNVYADKIDPKDYHKHLGEKNEAVRAIFGHKKELDKTTKKELGQKGKILISDCFRETKEQTKVFDHVSIDRFTGGAIDGALFQEKTVARDDESYSIEILLENDIDDKAIKAFECALTDIVTGMLPLGGATTKGHGVFCGEVVKDGQLLEKGSCDDL